MLLYINNDSLMNDVSEVRKPTWNIDCSVAFISSLNKP